MKGWRKGCGAVSVLVRQCYFYKTTSRCTVCVRLPYARAGVGIVAVRVGRHGREQAEVADRSRGIGRAEGHRLLRLGRVHGHLRLDPAERREGITVSGGYGR